MRTIAMWGVMMTSAAAVCGAQTAAGKTALTIYNQDFAVVRTHVDLKLRAGTTEVTDTDVAGLLEPDSVILRDETGKQAIKILEQNFDAAIGMQSLMLAKFEGKTIDFQIGAGPGAQIVQGRIVRAGTVPQYDLIDQYGQNYFYQVQNQRAAEQPLIEVNGKLMYQLPGTPLFPTDGNGATLRPTLRWLIGSTNAAHMQAKLEYITRGLRWNATYNIVAPAVEGAAGQRLEMVGWVALTNESGTDFDDARLQLMAGDVSKLRSANDVHRVSAANASVFVAGRESSPQEVTQKSFDDYHLYDLKRTATLRNHESKQIEFLRAQQIPAERVYVYDGTKFANSQGQQYLQWNQENLGLVENKKVWTMEEFRNSEANHLGMPLPQGRMRFYRRDTDGSLQFVGENTIDHTPKDELVRVYLGNAFDLTGEHTRTDFKGNFQERKIVESFKVVVRNAKDTVARVRVVEHMYRTASWEINSRSDEFTKMDAQTIEFAAEVAPHGEKTILYTVTYTW